MKNGNYLKGRRLIKHKKRRILWTRVRLVWFWEVSSPTTKSQKIVGDLLEAKRRWPPLRRQNHKKFRSCSSYIQVSFFSYENLFSSSWSWDPHISSVLKFRVHIQVKSSVIGLLFWSFHLDIVIWFGNCDSSDPSDENYSVWSLLVLFGN